MKIVLVTKKILPFGYGFTLWKLVLVRRDGNIPYLIAHEATHVKQWTEIGLFKFPLLYAYELIKHGYAENKYEVEAREQGYKNSHKYTKYK